jgi:hypothetical protein
MSGSYVFVNHISLNGPLFMLLTRYTKEHMSNNLGKLKFQIDSYDDNGIQNLEILNRQYQYSTSDESVGFKPFAIKNLQSYNPIYSLFFDLTNRDHLALKHRNRMIDLETVMDTTDVMIQPRPTFIKFSPLLDPVKYMIGKYDVANDSIRTLPNPNGNNEGVFPKLVDYNNAAYIDCFFSFLTSQLLEHHGVIHGLDYYGSYLGVQDKFKMNAADDIEYIGTSDYFHKNLGKQFLISDKNYAEYSSNIVSSRANKNKLSFLSTENDEVDLGEIVLDDIETLDTNADDLEHEIVYEKEEEAECSPSDSSDSSLEESDSEEGTDEESEEDGSDEESEESEESDEGSEQESEERELFAYIDNFPVQLICLEKCKGTFDSLFERGLIDDVTGAAALMQIIMILIIYQKTFSFTHNDLHTNNIMYIDTDIEYLYYIVDGKTYRVPTYGKIYKIIDFGRGIYKFNGKLFCSDSFALGGDAATQYNCEPYMNENKPRLEPNPSFDLCRLACSIYDFVIDDESPDEMDDFQKLILAWCTDDNGKNVLYKRNGEERYPNFKLYKMIARTVHNGIPKEQLALPLFSQFLVDSVETNLGMNIDDIPVYV